MKIGVNSHGGIELEEVFNSVTFKTEDGQILAICMRDGGFEIGLSQPEIKDQSGITFLKWYTANQGIITPLSQIDLGSEPGRIVKHEISL